MEGQLDIGLKEFSIWPNPVLCHDESGKNIKKNNCYIGYNDYYDKLYPTLGLNRNGKLDFNLDYEDHSKLSYVEYSLILKKAGRL